jgi:hypothetical protein
MPQLKLVDTRTTQQFFEQKETCIELKRDCRTDTYPFVGDEGCYRT